MADQQEWQMLLANIVQFTDVVEGHVVIEIFGIKHDKWVTLPGDIHEFRGNSTKYIKEWRPILNLIVKLGCRCTMHNTSELMNTTDQITADKLLEPKEQEELDRWFMGQGGYK